MRYILGIDPGTKCGWALLRNGEIIFSGVWDLKPGPHDGAGMRYLKLRCDLRLVLPGVDAVAYEEVAAHKGTRAAHVYGGVVATITALCEDKMIPYRGIPVGTVKRTATGKGNANKAAMMAAARERWPGVEFETDDVADAAWVAEALRLELGAG